MNAFKEDALFEQGNIEEKEENSFYLTGSNISLGNTPGTFSGGLQNKHQIKLSFFVDSPTTMLERSSSIYYFNSEYGCWALPPNSIDDHVGPFSKLSFPTKGMDLLNPERGSGGTFCIVEDFKCFDPYGRNISSGSLDVPREDLQVQGSEFPSNEDIKKLGSSALISYLTKDYKKSVQRSSIYDAPEDQTFKLDIKEPFLIEKVVVEIPCNSDYRWYSDKTLSLLNIGGITAQYNGEEKKSSPWTVGGPGVTFSLFCQKKYGQTNIRDLICSKILTNPSDCENSFDFFQDSFNGTYGLFFYNKGIKGASSFDYNNLEKKSILKMTPSISNGMNTGMFVIGTVWKNESSYNQFYNSLSPGEQEFYRTFEGVHFFKSRELFEDHIKSLIYSEYCKPSDFSIIGNPGTGAQSGEGVLATFFVHGINSFGRGMTGFSPSGGSIFGKEYTSVSSNPITENPVIDCPFWIKDETGQTTKKDQLINKLKWHLENAGNDQLWNGSNNNFNFLISLDVNLFLSSKDSPYLIYPGDNLILAASKTRSAIGASNINISQDSNSDDFKSGKCLEINSAGPPQGIDIDQGHGFTLESGKINITFYGSYVSGGNRFVR